MKPPIPEICWAVTHGSCSVCCVNVNEREQQQFQFGPEKVQLLAALILL